MHTNEPREDPLIDMGYETRDVDFPKLKIAAAYYYGFAVFCGLLGLTIYLNRFFLLRIAAPKDSGAVMNRKLPVDPYPLLQGNITAKTDIATMRREETRRLDATEYANDAHTVVHIPVEQAMKLLVQRGLPKVNASMPAGTPNAAGAATTSNPAVLNNAGMKLPPAKTPGGAPKP